MFTTATFVGYLLAGGKGAAVATVGIFLPAFVFVAASAPIVAWLRRSKPAGAFLDGVNVASLALMAMVTFRLGAAAIVDFPTAAIAVVSVIGLTRLRMNSLWLLCAFGALGWLIAAKTRS